MYYRIIMKTPCLSPSLLSADFANLGSALSLIKKSGAEAVHIDVMDGHFVPPVSYGQPVVKSIRKCSDLMFDVHLMVEKPENCIESFAESGADWITFHEEATDHADFCINKIHSLGKKAGIAINPATPVSALERILPLVDLVLVMTVNPGWGGQKIIPYCVDKVRELVLKRKELSAGYLISVDGGINSNTVNDVLEAGTDIVVSGSSFFSGELKWKGKE